jgi:lipopolysaccharide assembly outer membrane protein LptD (OstA)
LIKGISKYLFVFISAVASLSYSQQQNSNVQDQYITVIGDSLRGNIVEGESIREVFGHVVLTQGRVRITCEKAVQYLSHNDAILEGNVVAKQDTLTIYTPRALYFGNEKRTKSISGIKLNDTKVILTADSGDYYFKEDRAFFQGRVRLYDTATTLTSKELTYFKLQNRMIAHGNVKIVDSTNTITADSLEHFRTSRITFANNNVKITSVSNNVVIYGDHLEDYGNKAYTFVSKNPLLIQIDSSRVTDTIAVNKDSTEFRNNLTTSKSDSNDFRIDTLIIRSEKMEAFRDTSNRFVAEDSVRLVRGSFASKNDYSIFYRSEERIVTKKMGHNRPQPVLWNDNTQMTGDSVAIHLLNKRIRFLDVIGNSFLLSRNDFYKNRFDQISGEKIFITFDSTGISSTEVKGQVLSIYYLYEKDSGNGLTKSSSQNALLKFENKKVVEVRMYGFPKSDYYPENQVGNKELSFTLPGYVLYTNKPKKENLLYK